MSVFCPHKELATVKTSLHFLLLAIFLSVNGTATAESSHNYIDPFKSRAVFTCDIKETIRAHEVDEVKGEIDDLNSYFEGIDELVRRIQERKKNAIVRGYKFDVRKNDVILNCLKSLDRSLKTDSYFSGASLDDLLNEMDFKWSGQPDLSEYDFVLTSSDVNDDLYLTWVERKSAKKILDDHEHRIFTFSKTAQQEISYAQQRAARKPSSINTYIWLVLKRKYESKKNTSAIHKAIDQKQHKEEAKIQLMLKALEERVANGETRENVIETFQKYSKKYYYSRNDIILARFKNSAPTKRHESASTIDDNLAKNEIDSPSNSRENIKTRTLTSNNHSDQKQFSLSELPEENLNLLTYLENKIAAGESREKVISTFKKYASRHSSTQNQMILDRLQGAPQNQIRSQHSLSNAGSIVDRNLIQNRRASHGVNLGKPQIGLPKTSFRMRNNFSAKDSSTIKELISEQEQRLIAGANLNDLLNHWKTVNNRHPDLRVEEVIRYLQHRAREIPSSTYSRADHGAPVFIEDKEASKRIIERDRRQLQQLNSRWPNQTNTSTTNAPTIEM